MTEAPMNIRVLLVDDHRIMLDGLRAVLEKEPDLEVVGDAQNGRLALQAVEKLSPHVVVMDIGMSTMNGIEATREIRLRHPDVRVVALSTYSDKRYVLEMIEAGASAYVLKVAAYDELSRAIRAVSKNQSYLSPEVAGAVVGSYVGRDFPSAASAYKVLGHREREVLQLLAEGKTSSEIGAQLSISTKTVETHRRNLMQKLDLHSVAELTKYAVREGLTTLES